MKFRTEISIPESSWKINHKSKIFSLGSCFSDTVAQELKQHAFQILNNPFGVLFNPFALENCLSRCLYRLPYQADELSSHAGVYFSWDHNSSFDNHQSGEVLKSINQKLDDANEFLQNTDVLILTLGTAWVYEIKGTGIVVANCHKVPPNMFIKRLLEIHEIKAALNSIQSKIEDRNPNAKIILSISPVRHLKDGFIENQRSKARMVEAVHDFCDKSPDVNYFPSYEVFMDDLRDYRFYSSDLVHPSRQGFEYVWHKFTQAYFNLETKQINKEVTKIRKAFAHKPLNPKSTDYLQFIYKAEKNKKSMEEKLNRTLELD